jgi:SET domain-containing protein
MEKDRFVVKQSKPGTGRGLFARVPIARGEFILEYTGRHIPNTEADALSTKYLFELDDTWTIDGSARSNTARYINHACDPNTEAEIVDGHVLIHACRHIAPGEELTIDYGEEYFDEFIKPFGCRCERCATEVAKERQ